MRRTIRGQWPMATSYYVVLVRRPPPPPYRAIETSTRPDQRPDIRRQHTVLPFCHCACRILSCTPKGPNPACIIISFSMREQDARRENMPKQLRRRSNPSLSEEHTSFLFEDGWDEDVASKLTGSSGADAHLTTFVRNNGTSFHDSKNLKAGIGMMQSLPSFADLSIPSNIFPTTSPTSRGRALWRDNDKAIVLLLAVVVISVLFLGSGDGGPPTADPATLSPSSAIGEYEVHTQSMHHHKVDVRKKYLQKSQMEGDDVISSSEHNADTTQQQQPKKPVIRSNSKGKRGVLNQEQQEFLNQHIAVAQTDDDEQSAGVPARVVPPNAQIRAIDVMVPPMELDDNLRFLSPITEPYKPGSDDIPFFWEISGGDVTQIIHNVLSCRGAVLASKVGSYDGNGDLPNLQVVSVGNSRYVNVDTSTEAGLNRAKNLGLANSDLVDVIFTPLLHPAMRMFDASGHRARAFTILRHPVERSVNTFLILQNNNNPAVNGMSLQQYAQSPLLESNWMVRSLTGKMGGELTLQHLDIAKEVLATRFVVGLRDDKFGSVSRFERYFGWVYSNEQADCRQAAFQEEEQRQDIAKQMFVEGGEAIELLWRQNDLDIQLFDFVDALYRTQAAMFSRLR